MIEICSCHVCFSPEERRRRVTREEKKSCRKKERREERDLNGTGESVSHSMQREEGIVVCSHLHQSFAVLYEDGDCDFSR